MYVRPLFNVLFVILCVCVFVFVSQLFRVEQLFILQLLSHLKQKTTKKGLVHDDTKHTQAHTQEVNMYC